MLRFLSALPPPQTYLTLQNVRMSFFKVRVCPQHVCGQSVSSHCVSIKKWNKNKQISFFCGKKNYAGGVVMIWYEEKSRPHVGPWSGLIKSSSGALRIFIVLSLEWVSAIFWKSFNYGKYFLQLRHGKDWCNKQGGLGFKVPPIYRCNKLYFHL